MASTNIKETKKQLHELIDNVNDSELLDLYLQLLVQHTLAKETVIKASPQEIRAINESLEAVKQHGTISHEDAMARLKAKFPNLSF